jgi:hypothetical protein
MRGQKTDDMDEKHSTSVALNATPPSALEFLLGQLRCRIGAFHNLA